MNSNDLFSFLEEEPPEDELNDVQDAMDTDTRPEIPKKRKADGEDGPAEPKPRPVDVQMDVNAQAGPSEPKKLRLFSPNPLVVDEVEIEAKREVAASAGFGAVEANSRLELKHQVRSLYSISTTSAC